MAPPIKFFFTNWTSPNLKYTKWLAFSIGFGSTHRFLARRGSKYFFILWRSFFALLKPKTGRTLQYFSTWSCKSMSWFVCVCKNCVVLYRSSSPLTHPCSISNTGFLWQRRRLRTEKVWLSLQFILVSIAKRFDIICALLIVANLSRASTNDSNRALGMELHKKIGSSINSH